MGNEEGLSDDHLDENISKEDGVKQNNKIYSSAINNRNLFNVIGIVYYILFVYIRKYTQIKANVLINIL